VAPQFEGLFHKNRHCQSDKFRRNDRSNKNEVGADRVGGQVAVWTSTVANLPWKNTVLVCQAYKKQEARSFLTGLLIGWIELKGRSAGGWRSGLQRSEK
jgi:hypothetical protein